MEESDFVIQAGPVPPKKRTRWPYQHLEVNHFFVVNKEQYNAACTTACYWGKKLNRRFAVRTAPNGTVQVWRIPGAQFTSPIIR